MKVLVTGATGFIGNYVIESLLNKNIFVIATSLNEEKAKEKKWFKEVNYISHDINKNTNENLFIKFQKPDYAIHLAWDNLDKYKSQIHLIKTLPAHEIFLKNLIKNGLKDLSCIGTCFEYGLQEGELYEDMEDKPVIEYAMAKSILLKKLELLKKNYFYILKWIRLFYTYGKGQPSSTLFAQLDKAIENNEQVFNMSQGEQLRDYIPVEKMAEKIVNIANQKKTTGIINCCSGRPIMIKQLVKDYIVTKKCDIKLNLGFYPYPDYEPMGFWGSTKKIKSIINE